MWKIFCLLHVLCARESFQQTSRDFRKVEYQYNVEKWLNNVDSDLSQFNALAAHLTWKLSTAPDEKTSQQARQLGKARNRWKNKVCESTLQQEWMTPEQRRKMYLMCRGPKFTDEMVLRYLEVLGTLAEEYNAEVCLRGSPVKVNRSALNFPKNGDCLYGEPDLERVMKRTDLDPEQLKWIWLNWHDSVGPRVKDAFRQAVGYQNVAAGNNGYHNIGEAWREELETPDLEKFVFGLYEEVEPLYSMLHAVVRHKLYQKYGPSQIDLKGPIPTHLLGNMWGQDWSPLLDLFEITSDINLEEKLQSKSFAVKDMVLDAEDFYISLGLPKMTDKFWKYSKFEEGDNTTLCHGTAANLYSKNDFRMLMCGSVSMDDFYIIHHEMGHIEYYMAYQEQPAIFQDGTTTAFHESIGDAVMHGVMTPQHLHRLSLLNDNQLVDNNTELFLLFHQALSKIPEIPFSLIIDKYRWDIFKGDVDYRNWNKYYWELTEKYRGIVAPEERSARYFDAGAKFHIPDNTPYIRYFLSSILQMQIFKSLCEYTLYGQTSEEQYEEDGVPLHKCDIYGSKNAGKKLLAMMEKGASIHWSDALQIISGTPQISTKPFLEYYNPIYRWLKKYIENNNVYVGW